MSHTITDMLVRYWKMTDEQKAALDAYRTADGDTDDERLADYDDSNTTWSIEASDFLDGVMAELAALFPLPLGLKTTVPGSHGSKHTVITGQLDDAARAAFTQGQCHAFARALSLTTGWPMAMLISDECSYDPDMCSVEAAFDDVCACRLTHVVVERPDGAHVDIRGAHRPGYVPGFEGLEARDFDEMGWKFLAYSPHWRRPALDVARTFTAPLLARIADELTAP